MIKKVVKKKPIEKKIPSKKHPVKIIKKTVTTTTTTTPHKTRTSKKKSKRKTRKAPIIRKQRLTVNEVKLEKVLIENFVGLQKVMVNLSVKFDDLSSKLSKLLDLFEISARALAEKDITMEQANRDNTRMIKGLENLSDQNRIIARGITLMNEKLDDEPGYPGVITPQIKRPMQPTKSMMPKAPNMGEYQESISSKPPTFKRLPT